MGTLTTSGSRNITTDVALASTAAITLKTIRGGLQLITAAPGAGGLDYAAGDILDVTLAGAGGGRVKVKTVDGSGTITAYETAPNAPGSGYVTGANYATVKVTGAGDGNATVTVGEIIPGTPVVIHQIDCSLIADLGGAQCGKVTLRDGAVVIWAGYVFGTVNAATQGVANYFPLGITFAPRTDVNVLYTAVTNASTASVSVVWST